MSDKQEAELAIENDLGLHARAAMVFVQQASQFESEIILVKDGREVNGKSIMGILTLVASKGSRVLLRTEGPDAKEALIALRELVANRFGEDH